MTMPVSEKNFLERIASHIPGLAGYREREGFWPDAWTTAARA
jgi:hypothetical protein